MPHVSIDPHSFTTLLNGVFSHSLPDDVLETRLTHCGGDSILAATLSARCFRQYGVKVPVSLILRAERLHVVLDYIRDHATGAPIEAPVRADTVNGRFAQNAAQQQIYYAHRVDVATTAYNIPLILRTASAIPAARFQQAVTDAARQFPMLFSRFNQDPAGFWFELDQPGQIALQSYSSVGAAAEQFVQTFNLDGGALLRAGIVPFNGVETVLLLDFSHIAADGLSVGQFVRSLKDQLTGAYTAMDTRTFWPQTRDVAPETESFWQERLKDVVARPQWPTDRLHAATAPLGYEVELLLIDATLAAEIRLLAMQLGATPFSVLLLAYALLQTSFTREWSSHVGVVVSGRVEPEIADVFGMFVNTVIVPFALENQGQVGTAIQTMAAQFLATLDHQSYPFQAQLHHVKNRSDTVRPTLDALLVYQNIDFQKIEVAGGKFGSFYEAKKMAQLPQVVHVFDLAEQGYEIQWEYCPQRFDAGTIGVFTTNFQRILRRLVSSPASAALKTLIEPETHETQSGPIVAADFDF